MKLTDPEPTRIRVEAFDIEFASGRTGTFTLRLDRGDTFEAREGWYVLTFHDDGGHVRDVVTVNASHVALMSRRTAELVVLAKPLTDAATKAPTL